MTTNLNGGNFTETFTTNGPDGNGPYHNYSTTDATLTLETLDATVVTEGVGAIDETEGQITLDVTGFHPGFAALELNGANTYSGGTVLLDSDIELDATGALGSGGIEFGGFSALNVLVSQTLTAEIAIDAAASADFGAGSGKTLTLNNFFVFGSGAPSSLIFGDDGFAGTVDLAPSGALALPALVLNKFEVDGGTLIVGNAEAAQFIDAAQGWLAINDLSILDLDGQSVTAFNLRGDGGGIIRDSGSTSVRLTLDNTANSTFSNQIEDGTGGIAVVIEGAAGAVLTLTSDNTYSGGTTIDSGAVTIGQDDSLGTGRVTFAANGATLEASAGFNFSNTITIDASVSADIAAADDTSLSLYSTTATGFDVGAGATVHFGMAGDPFGAVYLDPTVLQTIDPTAQLVVDGGFLLPESADGAAAIDDFASVTIGTDSATHAAIDLNGFALTLNNLSGNNKGNIQNDGATAAVLTLNTTVFLSVFDGNIHGEHGAGISVVITGSGVLDLADDNTYTGGTTIDANAALFLGVGGTTGSILGDVDDNGVFGFARTADTNFAGKISDGGRVEIFGASLTTLSGDNTFQGGVEIARSGLGLTNANAAGKGTIVFDDMLTGFQGLPLPELIVSGSFDLSNAITVENDQTVLIAAADNQTVTLNSTGAYHFDGGTGTTLQFGTNLDAGSVFLDPLGTGEVAAGTDLLIDAGVLGLNNPLAATMIGEFANDQIASGATFDLGGFAVTLNNLTGAGTLENTGSATSVTLDGATTFSGDITNGTGGAVSVVVAGSGVTTLSGANSFTGGVKLVAGVLDLDSASAAGKGTITFAGAGVQLRFEAGDLTADPIAGLAAGDSLDFVGIDAGKVTLAGDNLELLKKGKVVASLMLAGANKGLTFSTAVTANGTMVYVDVPATQYASLQPALDGAVGGFVLTGSAAELSSVFSQFGVDSKLKLAVVADDAVVQVSASNAPAALGKLQNADGSAIQVAIADSTGNVAAELGALLPDAAQIASIAFNNKPSPTLTLTAAQKTTDKPLLAKIVGRWILDVHNVDGSVATVAHGAGLTVNAVAGTDTLSGALGDETYVVAAGLGHTTFADFSQHLFGVGHDFVDLSKSEFGKLSVFLDVAKQVGADLVIAEGANSLTFDDMTKTMLREAAGDFKLS